MDRTFLAADGFLPRHLGPRDSDIPAMLETIKAESLDALVAETIPEEIRTDKALYLPAPLSEFELLQKLREIAGMNRKAKSYIGLGYSNCIVPAVIQRNIFENPGWYTQYTPYQSEISQGRLEALLNFQTMVMDLTGMEVANASLLDEATAAAEAMTVSYRLRGRDLVARNANKFLVAEKCLPQTIEVLKTRAEPLGIEVEVRSNAGLQLDESVFGVMLQYPDADGLVNDYSDLINQCHAAGALVTIATDLLALTLLTPPGEIGADIVVGSSQRFGVPMGYGGPHAAFFATRDSYRRQVPGRIIGVTIDAHGNPAYRMALQTREQHIRREKATSNICTAQALLAIMAGMYGVYHGPQGLRKIALRVHSLAVILENELKKLGYEQLNNPFFDTLLVRINTFSQSMSDVKEAATAVGVNLRYIDRKHVGITLDETTRPEDIQEILDIFGKAAGMYTQGIDFAAHAENTEVGFSAELARKSDYLQHPIFNRLHSETLLMRYIKSLENKDLSLTSSMIPLGSCTMKLNPASTLMPVSWPEFAVVHPFAPLDQVEGYQLIFDELQAALCEITGFTAVSLQPNSGAQGEYAGLLVIRAFHKKNGQGNRSVVLIPASAHGTNPASAVLCGMQVVIVKCDDLGNIDAVDLRAKAEAHKDALAALMVTYPSTHGVYEDGIKKICDIVHEFGGQVYMDGANLNAQLGLTSPAAIGADVCHLNLHKTFSIPHGGGGPGIGPIAVAAHLAPYLPGHPLVEVGGEQGIGAVAATPWGSASILLISYAYIKMLGSAGLTQVSKYAILNANYIKARLESTLPVLYVGQKGRVAHELIFDLRPFRSAGVEVEDVAKRLMDYGFHAPTVSFPVAGTLMVEPTESEDKEELDRFCEAMLAICAEIKEIEDGVADREDNLLKNAPHTAAEVMVDDWSHPYARTRAAYPLTYLRGHKFWPPVGRVDNVYGDRNLVCACPPVESYEEGHGD